MWPLDLRATIGAKPPSFGDIDAQDNLNSKHIRVTHHVSGHSFEDSRMGEEYKDKEKDKDKGRIPLWLDCDPGQYLLRLSVRSLTPART
jgi:hypothetical protein